jgi:hypothetical protein
MQFAPCDYHTTVPTDKGVPTLPATSGLPLVLQVAEAVDGDGGLDD